jgi:hypothetical protein
MTAPLAWAYAIPYERFLDPGAAVAANLNTLRVVSAWRVLLMTRVAVVLFRLHWLPAVVMVLGFGDVILFVALALTPVPLLEIMSGLRNVPPGDNVLAEAHFGSALVAFYAAIVLVPTMLAALARVGASWQLPGKSESTAGAGNARRLAWLAVLIWLPILLFTQREQQLKYQVEHAFRAGRKLEALEMLSAHTPEQYPPGWNPPPCFRQQGEFFQDLLGRNETVLGEQRRQFLRDVLEMNQLISDHPQADWVQRVYRGKLGYVASRYPIFADTYEDKKRLADLVHDIPKSERREFDIPLVDK